MFFLVGPNVPPHLIDILIIEGSQNNLREDTLERCPGPQTRLIQKPRYEGDELVSAQFTCFASTKVQILTGYNFAGLRSYRVAPRVEEGLQAQKGYNARWRRIRHKA